MAEVESAPPEAGAATASEESSASAETEAFEAGPPAEPVVEETVDPAVDALVRRVQKLERRNRILLAGVVLALATGIYGMSDLLPGAGVVVRQKLMESKELTLLDNSGNPRLFLRMFSRVPVLQVLDSSGKPRMSLGLRFDDTPFIDLSDKSGTTRATLEMTESDNPALRLFDKHGKIKFQIN